MAAARYEFQPSFFAPACGEWYSGGTVAAERWGLYRMDHRAIAPPVLAPVTQCGVDVDAGVMVTCRMRNKRGWRGRPAAGAAAAGTR